MIVWTINRKAKMTAYRIMLHGSSKYNLELLIWNIICRISPIFDALVPPWNFLEDSAL